MADTQYRLRFPKPWTHYAEIEATFPVRARDSVELMLPVWTPGSYLVREYSRHLEGFSCDKPWRKVRKNRWRIETKGQTSVTVRYRVYGHEMTVRTNWIDDRFALIIPAATFLADAANLAGSCDVTIDALPAQWAGAFTGLRQSAPLRFTAANYDELVDCPIYLGSPAVHTFRVNGVEHLLVNHGEEGSWDGPAAAAATEKIVAQYGKLMRQFPYERYVFLNLIVEAGGGLEHANSTVLMTSRWAWGNEKEPSPDPKEPAKPSRHSWLDLVSHEFFHAWNVKRLRPRELGPFDYENENYTPSLWVAEGVTSYYGPLMVCRAGLISREAYLKDLSRSISQLQTTPGRLEQPLTESSFDAWIKYYRPHENSPNTNVSYYVKGALVAWLIDAGLRRATNGVRSLDDVMREAYRRYSGPRGFDYAEFFALAPEFDARPLVEGAGELDYKTALECFGLRFAPQKDRKPWLGLTMNATQTIETVLRGGPAAEAGLNAGDEIVAINGYRVTADTLERILASASGDAVVLVARRGKMMLLNVRVAPEPDRVWQLEPDPAATPEQKRRFDAWLSSL